MMRISWIAAAMIGLVSAAPASAAPGDPVSWFGFTFGTPVASYRATMGDPVMVTKFPDAAIAAGMPNLKDAPIERKARYLLSIVGPAFGLVTEGHGTVDGLEMYIPTPPTAPRLDLPADPNGVHLGDSESDLAARVPGLTTQGDTRAIHDTARGTMTLYDMTAGRVARIVWFVAGDRGAAPGPGSYADVAGDTQATALLEMQPNDHAGNLWEQLYYALHPCDGKSGRWHETSSALVRVDGRIYDHNSVACSTTGAKRDYWFDITASFGKH